MRILQLMTFNGHLSVRTSVSATTDKVVCASVHTTDACASVHRCYKKLADTFMRPCPRISGLGGPTPCVCLSCCQ